MVAVQVLGDIKPSLLAHGASLQQCTDPSAPDFQQYGCPPLNYQTRYFCGHHPDCVDPPDARTYARARFNLLQRYVWVGQVRCVCVCMVDSPRPCDRDLETVSAVNQFASLSVSLARSLSLPLYLSRSLSGLYVQNFVL